MDRLYIHTEEVHNFNAPREVVPIIINLIKPYCVLDVGCGTGTWLKVFEENGINDYYGIDGNYVDKTQLKIPLSKFAEADLSDNWKVNRRFDIVLCLEVAEHLPENVANGFIDTLTKCADTIIFSAAVPGQGGQNHLNEQLPNYWQEKFERNGFYFHDVIRPLIWDNKKVDWWYRQNIFLVNRTSPKTNVISCYHPDLVGQIQQSYEAQYQTIIEGRFGVWETFKIFIKAIKFKLFK